jgi:3-deoxy-manno-octulosonate cytidylyltransferase (CMP-KDO synthetase)
MKIAAVIPARFGSTRFPGKPLAAIAGIPMIERVYRQVARFDRLSEVVVASDDERILNAVHSFGGKGLWTHPEARCGTDRVAEAAAALKLRDQDIVINVQGDQPLLDTRSLAQVIAPLIDAPALEMSTLAFRIAENRERNDPKDVKVTFDANGYALYFSRSPIPFCRDPEDAFPTYKHLGVYAYRRWFLDVFKAMPEGALERIEKLEQLRVLEHGRRIRIVITEYDSPEVDLPEDIARIERKIQV